MNVVFRLLVGIGIGLAVLPAHAGETDTTVSPSFLSPGAPRDITEIYLRFHEKELCSDVTAIFLVDGHSLQVWCRARDGSSSSKLMKLLRPLSASYSVETFSSTLYPDESSEDAYALPPSLWENSELSDYLLTPLIENPLIEEFDMPLFIGDPADLYRRRLRMFSEQALNRGSELERIAGELSELTRMGTDHLLDPELESLALRICVDHCREMEKLAAKLQKSLERALPGDGKGVGAESERQLPEDVLGFPELAGRILESSRRISQGVHAFLYPEKHTVQLEELRRPGVLVSLEELRRLLGEYVGKMAELSAGD
jgi:hypothetical protein